MEQSSTPLDPAPGCTQVPLTSAAQLAVGMILTGPGWQTVAQVTALAGEMVSHQDLTAPSAAPGHVHTFAPQGRTGGSKCACGAASYPAREYLPVNGFIRTFILQPREGSRILTPDRWTVYLTAGAGEVVVGGDGQWRRPALPDQPAQSTITTCPILPELEAVWTLPAELRRWVELASAPTQADEG